jgi:acyl-CoA synthetase (AMP-forming)/AMP-acid ligase II
VNAAQTLAGHYAARPEQRALTLTFARAADQAISYRRLLDGAAGFAARLGQAQTGRAVVILLPYGETLIQAFWGSILAGSIPSILAPLSEKLSPEKYRRDLSALLAVTTPVALVTDTAFEAEARHAVAESGVTCCVLVLDGPAFSTPDFAEYPGMNAVLQDVMLLQHSSGTTGLQKGVALSQRSVFNQLNAYADAIALTDSDRIVSWLPLYHDMGLIASFVMPVLRGVPVVMLSPFDWVRAPARLLQAISTHRATLCWQPNFAYNFAATRVRDRELSGVDVSSMRAWINCSEPCYAHSHALFTQRFAGIGVRPNTLHTCYAMAENTFAVTQSRLDGDTAAPPGELRLSCGAPLARVSVRILGPDGAPVPEGHTGEIVVRSDSMLSGYYQREDLTADAFADGHYRTGDLGYLYQQELFVTGRKKDLIIVGGKNVYPNDLEQLASEVPGIHAGRVAAFGVLDAEAGTEEVVIVAESDRVDALVDGSEAQLALADAVRARITQNSDVAVRIVRLVPAKWLIKTSSGKVARAANRDKYLAQSPDLPA